MELLRNVSPLGIFPTSGTQGSSTELPPRPVQTLSLPLLLENTPVRVCLPRQSHLLSMPLGQVANWR